MTQAAPDAAPLIEPFRLGDLTLRNRIVMAPLTRNRAKPDGDVPYALHAEYYAQRASAGLLISEASQVSPQGKGYIQTPGCYSAEQVAGWRLVTDAVHAKGGRIFLQQWHVGRVSHPDLQPEGALPVAPSAIAFKAQAFTPSGFQPCPVPRALEAVEIPGIVQDYARASENALKAGFDGVEIHGANGYLIDQFLRDGANKRTDSYGGSIENRVRFALEVVEAVVKVMGAKRVGMRISPVSRFSDMVDSDPQPLYGALIEKLNRIGLAYLHVVEGDTGGSRDSGSFDPQALRKGFSGAYIANNGYTRDLALDALRSGRADLVAFGRPYIANPDLVERLVADAPLNQGNQATYYGGGAEGYTDYPFMTPRAA